MGRRVRHSMWHQSLDGVRADVVSEDDVRAALAKDLARNDILHTTSTMPFDDVTPELRARMASIARSSSSASEALDSVVEQILSGGDAEKRSAIVNAVQNNTALLQQWERAYEELRTAEDTNPN